MLDFKKKIIKIYLPSLIMENIYILSRARKKKTELDRF